MKKFFLAFIIVGLALVGYSVFATSGKGEKNAIEKIEKNIEKLEKFEIPDVESTKENPSSFFVGPQGQVRIISGTITEISTATPATDGVKVWGLNLRVDRSNAEYIPAGTSASSLKVGDKVNIKGTINKDTGVISASIVHLLPSPEQTINELKSKITELIERIRELQQKLGLPLTPLP
jgi:hypothetical protein